MNMDQATAALVLSRLNQEAIVNLLQQAGYKVAKPSTRAAKAYATVPTLNAVGKPYSPLFDPRYKVKHKTTTAHLFKPYGTQMRWVQTIPPSRIAPHA